MSSSSKWHAHARGQHVPRWTTLGLAGALVALSPAARADFSVSPTLDPYVLSSALMRSGVTITSAMINSGTVAGSAPTGLFYEGPLGIRDGILLTSGDVRTALPVSSTPPESPNIVSITHEGSIVDDPLCQRAMDMSRPAHDSVRLSIDFTLAAGYDGIQVDYIFGSEEYPQYVGSSYADAFGLYVGRQDQPDSSYVNFGTDLNGNSININGPFFGSSDVIRTYGPGGLAISEYNGLTPRLHSAINLDVGVPYRMIIVICDAGDTAYDSGVLLAALAGCKGECQGTTWCGDGVLQPGEACDDGNNVESDGCRNDCSVQDGWACTGDPGQTSQCAQLCGNGVVNAPFEDCEDGNSSNNDNCLNSCRAASCSDGFLHNQGSGTETDIDCGGDVCEPCEDDLNCLVDSDCLSGYCEPLGKVCEPPPPARVSPDTVHGPANDDTLVPVSALVSNDGAVNAATFELDSNTTSQGGSVTLSGGSVIYSPPASVGSSDTFTYTVCAVHAPYACSSTTVTMVLNQAPAFSTQSACVPVGTPSVGFNVANAYSDPEASGLNIASLAVSSAPNVSASFSGATLSITPNQPAQPARHTVDYTGCDSGVVAACEQGQVEVLYNDGPTLNARTGAQAFALVTGADRTVALGDFVANLGQVQEDAGSIVSWSVSTTGADGSWSQSVSSSHVNAAVVGSSLRLESVGGASSSTLYLQACESCGSGSVCTVTSFEVRVEDCYTSADCSTGVCDPSTLECVACLSDSDCAASEVCDNQTCIDRDDPPIAADDAYTTSEDTALTMAVLANDVETDGQAMTVRSFTQPASGVVSAGANGTLVYTPPANFHGQVSFTYEVCDSSNLCDTATVVVTVNSVNDAPVAVNDAYTTSEDTAVTMPVLSNDSDVDGDALALSSFTQPASGVVSAGANGTLVYTPAANFHGEVSFTYEACDAGGLCDEATVVLTVTPVNDAPVAGNDAFSTSEDTAVTMAVLSNDSDVDGDTLTVSSFTQPASGVVSAGANGALVYTPATNFHGEVSFTYEVCDAEGLCDEATVVVTVTPVNDAPVAVNDAFSTSEDTAVTMAVLSNDSDVDGDVLAVSSFTQPASGVVSTGANGALVYTPAANFHGEVSFSYEVCDAGGLCDEATVVLTVTPVNDAPVAGNDAYSTSEDTAVTMAVLSNDSDVDGDTLTVSSFTQPASGVVSAGANGALVYTPATNFHGEVSFTYEVCDAEGLCDEGTVVLTVSPVNDAPVALNDAYSTSEGTAVTMAVLSNDSDVDGDTLTISSFTQPASGVVSAGANGALVYTPVAHFHGEVSFTYEVCDAGGLCDEATVVVTVGSVNDAPVAGNDAFSTSEDTAVTMDVLSNDSDIDGDSLVVSSFTQPVSGVVSAGANGTLVYTPAVDFHGEVSFTYEVCDAEGLCDEGTVVVTVSPVNDAPVAVEDAFSTSEDVAVTLDVLTNDSDVDGDALAVSSFTQPASGVVSAGANGTLVYTPEADFHGEVSFTYEVCDADGLCDEATVVVTVTPVNDAPVAVEDAFSSSEDMAVTMDVLSNDSDVDGDSLVVSSFTQPASGVVSAGENGTLVYTPEADFHGEVSFTYEVCDADGLCDEATVVVTVGSVNDAPQVSDDAFTTSEDEALTMNVLANDSDVDGDALVVSEFTQPSHGEVTVQDDGLLLYTPSADFHGSTSFTYTACDDEGLCDEATVLITVNPVNDAPVAADDTASAPYNGGVSVDVLANDGDIDGDALTLTEFTQPENGAVVLGDDGRFTYTPNAGFVGLDSFEYTVCDAEGLCDSAQVTVDVGSSNEAPLANDDAASTDYLTPVSIDVLANDSDSDAEAIFVSEVGVSADGSVAIVEGEVVFTPNAGFSGETSFTYTVCDERGLCDTGTITVVVGDKPNEAPVALEDVVETEVNTPVSVPVLANDYDPDQDSLTVVSVSEPAHGTVTINPDGSITYTPDEDYVGEDRFTVTVSDGRGGTTTSEVIVTVSPKPNQAPVAVDDTLTVDGDRPSTVDVLANDSDPDGDALSISSVTQPEHGSVAIVDNQLVYTPEPGYEGEVTFTYTITDGRGESASAEVTLTYGDRDGDGIGDSTEVENGTDPDNADSDGDGLVDGDEVLNGTDPLIPDFYVAHGAGACSSAESMSWLALALFLGLCMQRRRLS